MKRPTYLLRALEKRPPSLLFQEFQYRFVTHCVSEIGAEHGRISGRVVGFRMFEFARELCRIRVDVLLARYFGKDESGFRALVSRLPPLFAPNLPS